MLQTQDEINVKMFTDAMALIMRHDFREMNAYLKVEYEIGGKYETPKTRFLIHLRCLEPEMIKALYQAFPDSRFWTEKQGGWNAESDITIHLKRPIAKDEVTT